MRKQIFQPMKNISKEQQKQIIQYLQTKNLSEDTIVEISEHFTNHINHLISKGKTFEEAFNETQNIWSKNLENTWISGFYQIPIIQKRKISSIRNIILKKSLGFSVILCLFILGIMFLLNHNHFIKFYHYYTCFIIVLPIISMTIIWRGIPFRKKIISSEDLFSSIIIGGFTLISSFHIRLNIDPEYAIPSMFIFIILIFCQNILTFYIFLSSIKFRQDFKYFKNKTS